MTILNEMYKSYKTILKKFSERERCIDVSFTKGPLLTINFWIPDLETKEGKEGREKKQERQSRKEGNRRQKKIVIFCMSPLDHWRLRPISYNVLRVRPPQLDGLVVFQGGGCNYVLCWVTSRAQDHVCVAGKLLDNFLGLQVPNVDLVVLRTGNDPLRKKTLTPLADDSLWFH